MTLEKKLQTEIIQWLRANGVYVIKTTPGAGTPVGCPDIIGLKQTRWVTLEVKASEQAKMQPLQVLTLSRLRNMNRWVYRVCPENWPSIKLQLQKEFL